MHPALLGGPPGKTIDISFSLRQDPLEQALFGEYNQSAGARFEKFWIFIKTCFPRKPSFLMELGGF